MTSALVNTTTRELVGSINLPLSYTPAQRVFDSTHIQSPRVKRSKQYIQQYKQCINTDELAVSNNVWNNSTVGGKTINGKIEPSWCTDQTQHDNRYYSHVLQQHIISQKQYIMSCIRNGIDYNHDKLAIHDRWNVSTQVDDPPYHSLHNTNDPSLQYTLRMCSTSSTGDVLYSRNDRLDLIQQQTLYSLQAQHKKQQQLDEIQHEHEQQLQGKLLQTNYNWNQLPHKNHRGKNNNKIDINDAIQQAQYNIQNEYSHDTLQNYIESKSNDSGCDLDDMFSMTHDSINDSSSRSRSRGMNRTSHVPPPRFISPRRTTLSASTKLSAAQHNTQLHNAAVTARTLNNPLTLQSIKQYIPYTSKSHTGEYTYNTQQQRSEWSCCHSIQHDCIGCISIHDPRKHRIITPGSTLGDKLWSHIKYNAPNVSESVCGTVVRYEHTGTYQLNGGTNELFWSCCMSDNSDSPGCKQVVVTREYTWKTQHP